MGDWDDDDASDRSVGSDGTIEGAAWDVDDDSEAWDVDVESDGLIAPRRGAEARRSAETTEGPAETTDADVDEDVDVDEEDSDDGWNDDDGRLAALPTNNPASRAPWRARLPHFVPVRELAVGAFHEGEIVHVDYAAQFGGVKSGAKARPAARSDRTGKAAYRASQKRVAAR
ncbi:hypothetical protein BE221DRAFT_161130 [Ostreococcus tauri]|uniref:Uncharacterized protein n=1 Tax=Ostreococcus tauri TaxID=70448 RepID=A0A1Y5I956_OSTTA|nr:hypothetical protein BE221DRAFT_161130 [Ostreococcus tauri]